MNLQQSILPAALIAMGTIFAAPATAQSIGFTSADLSYEFSGSDYTVHSLNGRADFAITGAHGVQFDLGLTKFDNSQFGHVAAHMYLMPSERQKYGLFVLYEDQDNEEFKEFAVGFEGLFNITDRTVLELRAGAGWIPNNGVDYIFAETNVSHALSDRLAVIGGLSVTNVEETNIAEQGVVARLGLTYAVPEIGLSLNAGVQHSKVISKRNYKDDTAIFVGMAWQFGGSSAANRPAARRKFSTPHPMSAFRARSAAFSWHRR